MKTFLARCGAFLLVQILFFAPFWNPAMPYEHNYLAATIDKHCRLDSTPSPRLILVGGSNLAFGIKSGDLQDELGLPVVNMGLNAHLGVPFILDEVKPAIQRGDVVILSLEHNNLAQPGTRLHTAQIVEIRPESLFCLSPQRCKDLIDHDGMAIVGGLARRSILQRFQPKAVNSTDPNYGRDFFDENGSYTAHYGRGPARKREPAGTDIPLMSDQIREKITHFAAVCRERGALCLFTCPPYPASLLSPPPEAISRNLRQIRMIPNLFVIDEPLDHCYADDLFFDSNYHLTEKGAELRTAKLAAEIRPFLTSVQ
jgi:hypothetical protein